MGHGRWGKGLRERFKKREDTAVMRRVLFEFEVCNIFSAQKTWILDGMVRRFCSSYTYCMCFCECYLAGPTACKPFSRFRPSYSPGPTPPAMVMVITHQPPPPVEWLGLGFECVGCCLHVVVLTPQKGSREIPLSQRNPGW